MLVTFLISCGEKEKDPVTEAYDSASAELLRSWIKRSNDTTFYINGGQVDSSSNTILKKDLIAQKNRDFDLKGRSIHAGTYSVIQLFDPGRYNDEEEFFVDHTGTWKTFDENGVLKRERKFEWKLEDGILSEFNTWEHIPAVNEKKAVWNSVGDESYHISDLTDTSFTAAFMPADAFLEKHVLKK